MVMDQTTWLYSLNKILGFVRFILVLIPMPGYIHPDEFFQSPEIMGNDVLSFKATRTWEWNSSFPLRNVLFPTLSSGLPFWMIKQMQYVFPFHTSTELLVVMPRCFMLCVAAVVERLLRCFCEYEHDKDYHDYALFLFRTSHVSLVFLPRTFSNNVELLLFCTLILIVAKSLNGMLGSFTFNFAIGLVISIGFFVRPTFLAFAFYPVFQYLLCMFLSLPFLQFLSQLVKNAFYMVMGILVGTAISIYADYCYYATKTLPITPLNFVLYNINQDSLTEHGSHPHCLHLVVNMLLLFGPLYIYYLLTLFEKIKQFIFVDKSNHEQTPMSSIMMGSAIVPVIILSIFQHQEPRYILPVLLPLIWIVSRSSKHQTVFTILWILFNFVGTLWYGFIHQGGLVPAISYLNIQLKNESMTTPNKIIFWRTYMPPKHLLAIKNFRTDVNIYDFGGISFENIRTQTEIFNINS